MVAFVIARRRATSKRARLGHRQSRPCSGRHASSIGGGWQGPARRIEDRAGHDGATG
jgi:hypothetical protein